MVVSAAREHLAAVIESATRTGEPVSLTRRGRSVAVVVDPAVCERVLTGNPRFDLIAAKAHAHGARLVTANVNDGDHLGTHDIGPGVQRIEPWSGNAA